MKAKVFSEAILNMFFPKRCGFCGKVINPQYDCCEECEKLAFEIKGEICPLCGFAKEDCVCKKHKNSYKAVTAPFYYEGGAKSAVWRLKFDGREQVASFLVPYMKKAAEKNFGQIHFDEITFVPISQKQKKERPYNHSEILARELSKAMDIPCRDYLVKLYNTAPQHTLKESSRKGNVLGIFDIKSDSGKPRFNERSTEKFLPSGKTILLCDDVKTTGSTLNECAKMLLLSGAKEVYCVCAAITKKQVDK